METNNIEGSAFISSEAINTQRVSEESLQKANIGNKYSHEWVTPEKANQVGE